MHVPWTIYTWNWSLMIYSTNYDDIRIYSPPNLQCFYLSLCLCSSLIPSSVSYRNYPDRCWANREIGNVLNPILIIQLIDEILFFEDQQRLFIWKCTYTLFMIHVLLKFEKLQKHHHQYLTFVRSCYPSFDQFIQCQAEYLYIHIYSIEFKITLFIIVRA